MKSLLAAAIFKFLSEYEWLFGIREYLVSHSNYFCQRALIFYLWEQLGNFPSGYRQVFKQFERL
jgi:hypothetical protein